MAETLAGAIGSQIGVSVGRFLKRELGVKNPYKPPTRGQWERVVLRNPLLEYMLRSERGNASERYEAALGASSHHQISGQPTVDPLPSLDTTPAKFTLVRTGDDEFDKYENETRQETADEINRIQSNLNSSITFLYDQIKETSIVADANRRTLEVVQRRMVYLEDYVDRLNRNSLITQQQQVMIEPPDAQRVQEDPYKQKDENNKDNSSLFNNIKAYLEGAFAVQVGGVVLRSILAGGAEIAGALTPFILPGIMVAIYGKMRSMAEDATREIAKDPKKWDQLRHIDEPLGIKRDPVTGRMTHGPTRHYSVPMLPRDQAQYDVADALSKGANIRSLDTNSIRKKYDDPSDQEQYDKAMRAYIDSVIKEEDEKEKRAREDEERRKKQDQEYREELNRHFKRRPTADTHTKIPTWRQWLVNRRQQREHEGQGSVFDFFKTPTPDEWLGDYKKYNSGSLEGGNIMPTSFEDNSSPPITRTSLRDQPRLTDLNLINEQIILYGHSKVGIGTPLLDIDANDIKLSPNALKALKTLLFPDTNNANEDEKDIGDNPYDDTPKDTSTIPGNRTEGRGTTFRRGIRAPTFGPVTPYTGIQPPPPSTRPRTPLGHGFNEGLGIGGGTRIPGMAPPQSGIGGMSPPTGGFGGAGRGGSGFSDQGGTGGAANQGINRYDKSHDLSAGRERFFHNQGNLKGVDANLLTVLRDASKDLPAGYRVEMISGHDSRSTGTQNHPHGIAVDVQIYDDKGRPVPNKAGSWGYDIYEKYYQSSIARAQKWYPNEHLLWGGGFVHGVTDDEMHFQWQRNIPGTSQGMAAYDPNKGLNAAFRRQFDPQGRAMTPEQIAAYRKSVGANITDRPPTFGGDVPASAGQAGPPPANTRGANGDTTTPNANRVGQGGDITSGATIPRNADPDTIAALNEVAKAHGLDPAAIAMVINTESGWRTGSTTGRYRGLTQIGPENPEWNNIRYMSPGDQIRTYGRWLDRYKFSSKVGEAGVNIAGMTPAQQAAYLQGFQFAPNATGWQRRYAQGDTTTRTTDTRQAHVLGDTSMRAMTQYYEGLYNRNPGQYTSPPTPGDGTTLAGYHPRPEENGRAATPPPTVPPPTRSIMGEDPKANPANAFINPPRPLIEDRPEANKTPNAPPTTDTHDDKKHPTFRPPRTGLRHPTTNFEGQGPEPGSDGYGDKKASIDCYGICAI